MEFVKVARKHAFSSVHGVRFKTRGIKDNDYFCDRLSHRHTTRILLVFIMISTLKRFFQTPITCWVPKELKRYEKFIDRYCWIKGTFYVNQSYDLNTLTIEARQEGLLQYYQWVYFFLLIQAFLFYMPRILWSFISQRLLDYDLFNLVDAAIRHELYSADKPKCLRFLEANLVKEAPLSVAKERQIKYLKHKIHSRFNDDNEDFIAQNDISMFRLALIKFSKAYLSLAYIFVKIMYLSVSILQIYLMNVFLSTNSNEFYGYQILQTIIRGESDIVNGNDSRFFPRITICDVKTREVGQDHINTVQCVLAFNLFNERLYAFLWFWIFCVVIPFTLIDLLAWFKRIFFFGSVYRYNFIKNRLLIYNKIKNVKEKHLVKLFTEYYIGTDGVFMLRLIEHNSNATVVTDLINQMWRNFKHEQKF